MRTYSEEHPVRTSERFDFVDVTDDIQEVLARSGIQGGQLTVFSPHTGCPILVNERESGLLADIRQTIERLAASDGRGWRATIGSSSVVLPVTDGKLWLGTWQRVLLLELEGPAQRNIVVQTAGE